MAEQKIRANENTNHGGAVVLGPTGMAYQHYGARGFQSGPDTSRDWEFHDFSAPIQPSGGDRGAAVGAAVNVGYPAEPSVQHVLHSISHSYTGSPANGFVRVLDGSVEVFRRGISAAGPFAYNWDPPMLGTKGNSMTVTLGAAGAAVSGDLSVYHTRSS